MSTETRLNPKRGWEATGVTGMAQLILIVVLHSDSALIKIHIVNEKRHTWEFENDTFILTVIYINVKLSVFTLWKC